MVSIVLALALAVLAASPPQAPLVVEWGRVGPVSIGATADSIYREYGDRARLVDLKLEGHLSPALEIRLFGSQAVTGSLAAAR